MAGPSMAAKSLPLGGKARMREYIFRPTAANFPPQTKNGINALTRFA